MGKSSFNVEMFMRDHNMVINWLLVSIIFVFALILLPFSYLKMDLIFALIFSLLLLALFLSTFSIVKHEKSLKKICSKGSNETLMLAHRKIAVAAGLLFTGAMGISYVFMIMFKLGYWIHFIVFFFIFLIVFILIGKLNKRFLSSFK